MRNYYFVVVIVFPCYRNSSLLFFSTKGISENTLYVLLCVISANVQTSQFLNNKLRSGTNFLLNFLNWHEPKFALVHLDYQAEAKYTLYIIIIRLRQNLPCMYICIIRMRINPYMYNLIIRLGQNLPCTTLLPTKSTLYILIIRLRQNLPCTSFVLG